MPDLFPTNNHHLTRTLYRYMQALEYGDLETVAIILRQAEDDRDLERMILEVNGMYQADDKAIVQPLEIEQAKDLLPSAFSASISTDGEHDIATKLIIPTRPVSRFRRVGALIQTLAAVLIVGLLIGGYLLLSLTRHFTPGSRNPSMPIVAVTTQDGVYALNPQNGTVLWDYVSSDTSSQTSVVTLQNGMAYFATDGGQVYALQETDGSLLWHTDLHITNGGYTELNIVYDAGVVFAGLADEQGYVVYALQASDGRVLWQSQKDSQVLAASGGLVYIAGGTDAQGNAKLEALQGQTGRLVWSYDTPPLSTIVENNVLYVYSLHRFIPSDFGGNKQYRSLAAFNAQNGKLLWSKQIIDDDVDPIVLAGNLILLGAPYDIKAYHLCAYRTSNGSQAWCMQQSVLAVSNAYPGYQNMTTYAAGNGLLYVSYSTQVSTDGAAASADLEAININKGAPVWSKHFANIGYPGLMTVLDGTIYATFDNTIYALSGKDGSELWNTRVSLDPPIELDASA
jgi:outer membrane protein assembly factor BamB